MSLHANLDGHLGTDPQLRYTKNGKPVTELSIGATMTRKNPQTSQWEPVGAPLWVKTTLWDDQALAASEQLKKGDQVKAEGTLTIDQWQDKQTGQERQTLRLAHPRIWKTQKLRTNQPSQPNQPNQANNDAWAAQPNQTSQPNNSAWTNHDNNDTPPF